MVMLSKRSSTLPAPTQEVAVGLHSRSSLTVRTMLLERTTESGRWNAGHGSAVRSSVCGRRVLCHRRSLDGVADRLRARDGLRENPNRPTDQLYAHRKTGRSLPGQHQIRRHHDRFEFAAAHDSDDDQQSSRILETGNVCQRQHIYR